MCGVIYRLKNFVNKKAAKNLHYSCVYSIVSYCIATWGGVLLCTHVCDALLRLQSEIIKNLYGKFLPFPSVTCLFREHEILKLDDVYKLRVSIWVGVLSSKTLSSNALSSKEHWSNGTLVERNIGRTEH